MNAKGARALSRHFLTLNELYEGRCRDLPEGPGIYMVVSPQDFVARFVCPGTGGWFKGKDPNESCDKLEKRWIPGGRELYIGAAKDLRERVRCFLQFGHGQRAAHRGGRYIWQLQDSGLLLLDWYYHPFPYDEEARFLDMFEVQNGRLPFANLKRGTRRK